MANRHFCNGCGVEVVDAPARGIRSDRPDYDDGSDPRRLFHLVEVRRAATAGSNQPLGIAGAPSVTGELCDECCDIVMDFVGDGETGERAKVMRLAHARA